MSPRSPLPVSGSDKYSCGKSDPSLGTGEGDLLLCFKKSSSSSGSVFLISLHGFLLLTLTGSIHKWLPSKHRGYFHAKRYVLLVQCHTSLQCYLQPCTVLWFFLFSCLCVTPGERQVTLLLCAVPHLFSDSSSEHWCQALAGRQNTHASSKNWMQTFPDTSDKVIYSNSYWKGCLIWIGLF